MKSWKLLKHSVAYQNRFRRVFKRRYRLPDGKQADFYLVDRGRVVCVFVLTKAKRVVIAKQFRPGPNRVMWELVGGAVESKETPRHAAIRETLEETGYRGRIRYLGASTNDAWSNLTRYHFLIDRAVRVSDIRLDDHEFIEPTSVSMTELRRLLRRGAMTDTETAYRALEYMRR